MVRTRTAQNWISHTVILLDWIFKKWGLNNFAFQHCKKFIGTINKKNFRNPVRDSWDIPIYPLKLAFGWSWTEPETFFLIKSKNGTLITPQMKSFGPKNFQISCRAQKVPFWQFFRKGRDGCALIVWPSKIPHRNSKNIFALGADEFLVMLEGKIREGPFF